MHFGGKRPTAGEMVNQRGAFVPPETIECQQRHMRSAGPAWRELGPEGNNQQHRQPLDPIDDAIEQLEARGIEPVSILGRHEHRLLGREALELGEQRLKRLRLFLFRCNLGGG